MKNAKLELFGRMQRLYHRSHPWGLSQGGLYIPHSYAEKKPDDLSWWDDVGFILNGRRVIVWWRHPRCVYSDEIDDQSWCEAGEGPNDAWLLEGSTKNYRNVGASRKKIVSYTSRQPSDEQKQHYILLDEIRNRTTTEGINFEVSTSWERERLNWAIGVSLVAPLEVRNEIELASVAQLARRLILGQTTLEAEFPGYCYGREDWIRDRMITNRVASDVAALKGLLRKPEAPVSIEDMNASIAEQGAKAVDATEYLKSDRPSPHFTDSKP